MTAAPLAIREGGGPRVGIANVGGTLATSAFTLVMIGSANVVIGRMLGVEGQGRVAAATLIPMIVAYAGEAGLPVATGYYVNARSNDRRSIISTARCIAVALGLVLTLTALGLIAILSLGPGVRRAAYAFSGFVILNLLYRLHLGILQADFRIRAYNLVRAGGAAVYLAILAVSWLLGWETVLGVIVALLVANVVWCVSAIKLAYQPPTFLYESRIARSLLGYGARAHLGNVSSVDALRIDQLVLVLFLGPRELGLYVAAMTIVTGNRVIGTSIGALCFPIASGSRGDSSGSAGGQFRLMLGLTLLLSLMVAIPEFLFGASVLTILFGPEFGDGGGVLKVLAIASVFMNLRQVCADYLRGLGRPGIVTVSELVSIVSLALLASVLWDGSVMTVAWAMSLAAAAALAWLGLGALFARVSAGAHGHPVNWTKGG